MSLAERLPQRPGVVLGGLREALRGRPCSVVGLGDRPEALPVHRWRRDADRDDLELARRTATGHTLDLGCGPGRLTAALARRGHVVLGIDVVREAVDQTLARGASALRRDVFDRLPGEGRWQTALLADGNVGIGGDPVALLRRARELIAAAGRVVVELAPARRTARERVGRAASAPGCAARRSAGPPSAPTTSGSSPRPPASAAPTCTGSGSSAGAPCCAEARAGTHDGEMIELRRAWFPAVVLAVTVVELVAAVVVPGVDQFDDKGWAVRLVVYPALMLAAPVGWWLTHRGSAAEPPYFAFGLLMLPFLSDTTANWLDLFREDRLVGRPEPRGALGPPRRRPRAPARALGPSALGPGPAGRRDRGDPRHRLGAGGVRAVHP